MTNAQIPLSVPSQRRREYKDNYHLLTKGRGRLLLIAGDQKVEHLNDDFFGPGISPEDANPEHLFKIAAESDGGVLATQLGLISRYGRQYRKLPYIVKINAQTNAGEKDKDNGALWWTVDDIVKFKKQSGLRIVGIGYTVYLGGKREPEILATAAKAVYEAHQAGLTAVIWMYPRGKNIKEENIHTIAGGAGVAAALDADFVKIKYPYGTKDKKTTAKKFIEAITAAGRTKVVCVGGGRASAKEFLEEVANQVKISGSSGLAIGRNLHQRPLTEAVRLTKALSAIIFHNSDIKEALKIYNKEKENKKIKSLIKKGKKSGTKFLGLF
ncbi:MAG: aldolase [Patescibacteria group bacterium]